MKGRANSDKESEGLFVIVLVNENKVSNIYNIYNNDNNIIMVRRGFNKDGGGGGGTSTPSNSNNNVGKDNNGM